MTIPKGATHVSPAGAYYHERGDGQYLYWAGIMGKWCPSPAANRGETALVPINSQPPTPEEDQAWAELERRQGERRAEQALTADGILQAAYGHMQDRAKTYDKPGGERSMGAAVRAYQAVTGGTDIVTEEQGWLFMVLLKAVRSQQGSYRADNYEDLAAYAALMGESAGRDRL